MAASTRSPSRRSPDWAWGTSSTSLERRSTGSTRVSRADLRMTPRTRFVPASSRLISRASQPSSPRWNLTSSRSPRPGAGPGFALSGINRARGASAPASTRRTYSSPSPSRSITSATPTGGRAPASEKPLRPRLPSRPSASSSRIISRRARRSPPFRPKWRAISVFSADPASRRKARRVSLSGRPAGGLLGDLVIASFVARNRALGSNLA